MVVMICVYVSNLQLLVAPQTAAAYILPITNVLLRILGMAAAVGPEELYSFPVS
jgi:hypothetical protein